MRQFTKQEINDFVVEEWNEADYPTYKEIKRSDLGKHGRWTTLHSLIFELEDVAYKTLYTQSACETSYGSGDFEDYSHSGMDRIWPVVEVELVQVTKWVWREKRST